MTTNQVLTDAEIRALIAADLDAIHYPDLPFARAVERAVLAKITRRADNLTFPSPYVNADGSLRGCVTEREARKRERAAWDACIAELNAQCSAGPTQKWWNNLWPRRDRLYPLPTCDKCGQEIK